MPLAKGAKNAERRVLSAMASMRFTSISLKENHDNGKSHSHSTRRITMES